MPERFVQSIGSLNNCKFVYGVVNVMEVLRQMIEDARKYFYVLTPQAPADITEQLLLKIEKSALKTRIILPENGLVPKRMADLKEKYHFNKYLATQNIERRMVRRTSLVMAVNDDQSMVAFPNESDNVVDFNASFYGEDIKSHDWCTACFNELWETSDVFDESKVQQRL
jgi:predicted transcriptional regulator